MTLILVFIIEAARSALDAFQGCYLLRKGREGMYKTINDWHSDGSRRQL